MNEKKCSCCKEVLPIENFYTDRSAASGSKSRCKKCEQLARKEARQPIVYSGNTKVCSRCKDNLPVENFVLNNQSLDGYAYYCKKCTKEIRTVKVKPETHQEVKAEYKCENNTELTKEEISMSELSIFKFEEKQVRTVMINEEPWFVARDVSEILGYSDTQAMTRRLDNDELSTCTDKSSGQTRFMTIINESGLYNAIIGSSKPEAKKFKKWVTSEVLPSIRKNGGYLAPQVDFTNPDVMINLLNNWKVDREKLIEANKEVEIANAIIKDQTPRIEYLESITESNQTIDMAKASKILNLGIGRNNLFALLRDKGILNADNEPYQRYVGYGWMKQVEMPSYKPDGTPIIYFKTVLYQKGLEAIRKIIIDAYQSQEYDDLFNC